jgi:hypothetical protein
VKFERAERVDTSCQVSLSRLRGWTPPARRVWVSWEGGHLLPGEFESAERVDNSCQVSLSPLRGWKPPAMWVWINWEVATSGHVSLSQLRGWTPPAMWVWVNWEGGHLRPYEFESTERVETSGHVSLSPLRGWTSPARWVWVGLEGVSLWSECFLSKWCFTDCGVFTCTDKNPSTFHGLQYLSTSGIDRYTKGQMRRSLFHSFH